MVKVRATHSNKHVAWVELEVKSTSVDSNRNRLFSYSLAAWSTRAFLLFDETSSYVVILAAGFFAFFNYEGKDGK